MKSGMHTRAHQSSATYRGRTGTGSYCRDDAAMPCKKEQVATVLALEYHCCCLESDCHPQNHAVLTEYSTELHAQVVQCPVAYFKAQSRSPDWPSLSAALSTSIVTTSSTSLAVLTDDSITGSTPCRANNASVCRVMEAADSTLLK